MKKLVLMCDYGLDDAAATLFVLDNRGETRVDILTIAGNSTAEQSYDNAKKLLSNYEGCIDGVRIIKTDMKKQNYCNLPSIHGNDGLGDFLKQKSLSVPELNYPEWIMEDEEIDLVSLGPCTLTKEIIQNRKVCSLLIMAGNVCEEPNFNGYEFNHYLDKEGFEYCVKNYDGARVATLDSCRNQAFNLIGKELKGNGLLAATLTKSRELASLRHPDNCYVYDYIAVQYLFSPQDFEADEVTDPDGNVFMQLRYAK